MTSATYFAELYTAANSVKSDVEGLYASVDLAISKCVKKIRAGGVVHLVGNGGSAAIVSHAQNDLVKAASIRAMVHQDVALLTATSNDIGYHQSVQLPLSRWLSKDDVLIVVSSSGESWNLLRAAEVARERGAFLVTCSGFSTGNNLRSKGHVNFYVPSSDYGTVELTHAALLHYLTDRLAA